MVSRRSNKSFKEVRKMQAITNSQQAAEILRKAGIKAKAESEEVGKVERPGISLVVFNRKPLLELAVICDVFPAQSSRQRIQQAALRLSDINASLRGSCNGNGATIAFFTPGQEVLVVSHLMATATPDKLPAAALWLLETARRIGHDVNGILYPGYQEEREKATPGQS